jgi:hypothetical protein
MAFGFDIEAHGPMCFREKLAMKQTIEVASRSPHSGDIASLRSYSLRSFTLTLPHICRNI